MYRALSQIGFILDFFTSQGHYKTKEDLFDATFRGNKKWYGFVSFLVEVYLNVRTYTGDRLEVLVTPVYNCLFQVRKNTDLKTVTHVLLP